MNIRSLLSNSWIVVLVLSIHMSGMTSYAQNDISILYSPMVAELAGERGSTVPFEIIIGNESRFSTAHFRTSVHGLAETPDGIYKIREDDWTFDAKDWIELEEEEFTIPPGGFYALRGVVRVPRRGPAAGYATIVTELIPEQAPPGVDASTFYYQKFSTSLEIMIGQRHKRSSFISEIQVIPTANDPELSMLYGRGRLMFLATLENDGDVHVAGRGQLIIRDMNGRRIRSVPLGSGRGVVIPEAKLEFGSVIGMLPPGEYEMEARIDFGGHRPAVARTHFKIGDDLDGTSRSVAGRGLRVDVTPSIMNMTFARQGYRAQTITVENYDTEDVRFTLKAEQLAHDENGIPIVIDQGMQLPHSAAAWAEIRPSEFVLKPGQRRNVVVGFRVPEALEGGRYAQIKAVAVPNQPNNNGTMSEVVTDLDVGAYLTIGTEHDMTINVRDMQWSQVPGQPRVRVGMIGENAGNIHFEIGGTLTLVKHIPARDVVVDDVIMQHDERWEVVEYIPTDVPGGPILPGESRFIHAELETFIEPWTQYRVVAEIRQPSGGRITKQLLLWTDEGGAIQEGTVPQQADRSGEPENE